MSRAWEEDHTGRVLPSLRVRVCAQYAFCGLITLHAGYNQLYVFSILCDKYNAAKLMDTWKGLLKFVDFFIVSRSLSGLLVNCLW